MQVCDQYHNRPRASTVTETSLAVEFARSIISLRLIPATLIALHLLHFGVDYTTGFLACSAQAALGVLARVHLLVGWEEEVVDLLEGET